MNEFYWITRLDSIDNLLVAFAILAAIVFIGGLVGFGVTFDEDDFDTDSEYVRKMRKYFKKMAIISGVVFLSTSTINTFIPSTKDAYIICGIGGTFEYLKTNDKAKQLPDKVIMAIDSYLDSKIKEQSDSID